MKNPLRQIQKHVSLDAQMLMAVASLHSGEMQNQALETVIYQVLTLQGCRIDGRPFQDPNTVMKVKYLPIVRKFNVGFSKICICLPHAFPFQMIKTYRFEGYNTQMVC